MAIDMRTRVVACGEKLTAERCLDFLHARDDTKLVAIFTSPQDWQTDLVRWGEQRQIRVLVGDINDYYDEIADIQPDFIFSLQYRRRLKAPVIALPLHGCVNLHFSLLPRYAGCHPIAWVILNGERTSGATLHYMTERFDEGDVLAATEIPIGEDTTARGLFDAISDAAIRLFTESYPLLRKGCLRARHQDLSRRLYYGKDSIDFERDRVLDWRRPAAEIHRRIRAFSFEPFQLPVTTVRLPNGMRVQTSVSRARLGDVPADREQATPGRILNVSEAGHVLVAAGDGGVVEIAMLDGRPAQLVLEAAGAPAIEGAFE